MTYEEWKKKREKGESTATNSASEDGYSNWLVKSGKVDTESIGNEISERVNTWLRNNENYVSNANNRFSGNNTSYRADASDWLSTVTTQKSNFEKEAEAIKSMLNQNKRFLNEDYINSVTQALDGNLKVQGDVISNATKDLKYWSQWETADAYNEYVVAQKDYNEKLNYDLGTGKAEIDDLQAKYGEASKIANELNSLKLTLTNGYTRGGYNPESVKRMVESDSRVIALKQQLAQYGDPSELASTLSEKKAYYTLAERVQKAAELASVGDVNSANYDPQFGEYANQGKYYRNPSINEAERGKVPVNKATYAKEHAVEIGFAEYNGAGGSDIVHAYHSLMTDEEVRIYSYYFGKGDYEKADEYLESLEETLLYRQGSAMGETLKGKPVLEYTFAVAAGLDQFATGVRSIFADGYTPASATQVASGIIREDLADTGAKLPDWLGGASIGQVGYDIINTTSNMLPSILVSTAIPGVGAAVGAGLLGASAGGNAKAEMLNLGYSKEQANAYGVMVGVAEAGMEYLLGGISKLGGKASGGLTEMILSKVDNAFARTAIKIGGSMLSEGFEEGLQTVIEPWLKEIVTSVDWEDPSIDEVLYSSLLGALSAFGLEGAGTVAGEVGTHKSGKTIQKIEGGVGMLQDLATNYFSADTVAYKIASKVNAQTDAYTIGRLLNEVGGTISEQNLTDIVNGLTEKGIRESDAKKIAKEYQNALYRNMNLSDEQAKILENLAPLADVLRKNIIGANTTVYQRTRAYSDLMGLANEVANGKKGVSTQKSSTTEKPSANIFEQQTLNADVQRIASEVATGTRTSAAGQAVKKAVNSASDMAAEKLGVEGKYTSSETGVTRLASNKKKVNVVGVDSIDKGTLKLKLGDGSIVNAEEIDFSTADQALVYEAVTNMGVNPTTAWEILKAYDPKSGQSGMIYAMGSLEAYTYGHNGVKVDKMSNDGFSALLSPVQKNTANRLGDIDARAKVEAQQKAIDKAEKTVRDEAKSKHKAIPKRKGGVVLHTYSTTLTDLQQSQIDVLERVSEGLGVTFHMFESKEDAKGNLTYIMPDGTVTGSNGWYDPKTGEIWIDINAGKIGQGTIIFTAAHELTHFIKQWSPAKFKVFADFLFEQYGKKGQSIEQLVNQRIESLKSHGRTKGLSMTEIYDLAYEEIVADSAQAFLRDSKAAEKIAALREKDKGLANKIKTFLGQMLAKMRKVLEDHNILPESTEAQIVAEMTDSLQKLYDLWSDALADAGEAYSTLADIDFNTDSVAPLNSERTWTASEYVTEREETAKKIAKALDVDIKTAYKYIDDINSVARLIADDRARLDYEPNLDEHATVLKPNSDYKYSVDMSTLCAKRLLFTGTFDAIQRALPNTVFDSEDIVALREMMQKRGYEVACGICYVESTRREIGRITQDFINSYKESQKTGKPMTRTNSEGKVIDLKKTNDEKATTADKSTDKFFAEKDYTPTLADLNTTDIDLVKRDHPLVYEAYLNFMNARGQAKPKLLETRAEYKGEILKHFKYKSAVTSRNNAGGLRLQSFSDFEVPHLIDMMQIVMDMSRVGLKSQAYTKVPAFAEVFGDTGVKINLSLIAKGDGLDANGNLVFDDVEGINHNEAFKLRDKYSKNVGTILVGKTDAHIIAAMADPRIDYIIPFHKSSWKESLYDALGLTGYADYTDTQHEKPIDKSRKISDYDPSEYWDFSKSGDENAQIYLAKCREDGRIPKFPQFQGYPGYWKLLIDFKMYDNDGIGSPQEVVKPEFNTEASERILSEYKGGHKSFPVAKDVVEDFVKEHKSNNNASENNGIRYMDRDGEAKDATQLSVKDLEYLLEQAQYGELKDSDYIPLRRNTPEFFIGVVTEHSKGAYVVEDYPMAATVEHLRQNMEEEDGQSYGNHRPHGFSVDDIITISKEMGHPSYIVKQENGRYAEVVSFYNKRNKKVVVSIDFANPHSDPPKNFKHSQYMNGYNGGYYNIVVTQFEPDDLKSYLENNEVVYDKTKMNGRYQVGSGRIVTVTHDTPFIEDIITQPDDSVNRETKKMSDRDSDGNSLSKEQQEFFKDSKVIDADTNGLMVLYHGSRNPLFTEFNIEKGVWLTPDQRYAEVYADMWHSWRDDFADTPLEDRQLTGIEGEVYADHDYRLYKMYANIINPLDLGEIDEELTNKGIAKLARMVSVSKADIQNIIDTYDCYMIYDVTRTEEYIEMAHRKGYDGFSATESGKLTFCVFNAANQVKLTSNKTPSENNDIRYSDRVLMGSLFSGGGTLEAGLVYQMLDKEFAVEYKASLASVYADNHGKEHLFVGDVQDFKSKGKQNVFYLHASPVCKNFSPASHKGGETELDILTAKATARVLAEQMPQVFTVENVKRYIGSEAYNIIINKLNELGYTWDVDVYKASDYGNATKRERMIIRAVKDGELPEKPQKESTFTSWGEATRDLWETDLIPSYLVKSKEDAIKNTPELRGIDLTKLDKPLMIYDTTKRKTVTFSWADELAPTLTTKCGDARIIMPDGKVYAPTPKFMGRIQGLPDDYKYPKAVTNAFKIIGNGIPTQLTKAVIGGVLDSAYEQTHDGQALYSDRDPNTFSSRSLLANALETTAQNDIEKNKLAQYKRKIDLIESEYAKLTELRAKIKKLSFAKGARDTKAIKALQFEANEVANRINTYDRQLLNLESTTALKNVLQREKELARRKEAQKGKAAIAKVRENAAKTQRALMDKNTESRKKAVESRNKTEMRGEIKKVVGDLNALLLDPTKDKHVPIGLQKPVAEALDIINMDTVGADERIAKYNAMIAKTNDPDTIAELTKSRDRIALQGENLADKLNALKQAYAEIKTSDDPLIKGSHDDAIEALIHNTSLTVGNTSLRNMSYEQLEAVYDMYKAILSTVRNANKLFKEGRQETITDNSEAVKREVRAAGGHRDRVLKATKFLKKFGWNMLKPLYAMKLIGSDTFTGLYENVRKGEDTWAVDVNEAKEFFKKTASKYEYNTWDFEKPYTFTDSVGNSFTLTLEQIMSLYAYSKREQADKHLEVGGFIFDDAIEVKEKTKLGITLTYEVNDANPYRLKKDDLGRIISLLDTDLNNVKKFVDEMQAYLSDVMGAKGNEVSLAMYDIKLYKEKNYFPLKSAKYFREFDPEKNGTPKIKNSGFSKKTVPQAGNPIILSNFMDVWANHVNDMSMYHAFVLPLEDFMRVYNYSSTAGGYDSVQQYIKNAYGTQANTYIETLMNDLNGGARTDPATDLIGKGMSLFKKAAVFASASVVIQQPSAIARALAYVDAKYFVDKPEAAKHKETWAEVKKYAPVAIVKEMGYFDTNMGRSTVDWIKEEKTWRDKVDDIASKAPALADELSWCAIWKAVKREVADTTKLGVGSEEFLKMAGKRFTEVVTKTQVYDSVLSRSALMRSKDTGAKMVTAFMAEPTTSLNMVVDAIIEGKRGNKKFAKKVVGAVSASIILNSILVSLVTAARDDDDDETYLEKYLESLTADLLDGFNPLTYIPLIKDIWSIAQGYDVERSDMSVWSDLWASVENLFSDKKSGFEKTEGVVGSIASFLGLPLKNLMRDARAIYNLFATLLSGTPTTWAGVGDAVGGAVTDSIPLYSRIEKWAGADESKSDKLYDAIVSGNQKHIDRKTAQYKDDKAIESAIRQGLRENDPRIHEAAQARYDGDIEKYKRIAKEIIAEGYFSQDTVVAAINAEINAIKKGEDSEEDLSVDTTEKVTSIYKASDINSAFESGDTDMALEVIDDLIKTKVANGMTEKEAKSSIRSSMTSYWKPLYKEAYKSGNTAEQERIKKILKESGLYGNASEVIKTCREWRTERD